jgi:hypothetical protein
MRQSPINLSSTHKDCTHLDVGILLVQKLLFVSRQKGKRQVLEACRDFNRLAPRRDSNRYRLKIVTESVGHHAITLGDLVKLYRVKLGTRLFTSIKPSRPAMAEPNIESQPCLQRG